jgi:hypothetical protein
MSIGTPINARATSSRDGTRCEGAERRGSPPMWSTENWASFVSNAGPDHMCHGANANPVGERSAGNPRVAFDERGEETETLPMQRLRQNKRFEGHDYLSPNNVVGAPRPKLAAAGP